MRLVDWRVGWLDYVWVCKMAVSMGVRRVGQSAALMVEELVET